MLHRSSIQYVFFVSSIIPYFRFFFDGWCFGGSFNGCLCFHFLPLPVLALYPPSLPCFLRPAFPSSNGFLAYILGSSESLPAKKETISNTGINISSKTPTADTSFAASITAAPRQVPLRFEVSPPEDVSSGSLGFPVESSGRFLPPDGSSPSHHPLSDGKYIARILIVGDSDGSFASAKSDAEGDSSGGGGRLIVIKNQPFSNALS